jgi:hypothetical protein
MKVITTIIYTMLAVLTRNLLHFFLLFINVTIINPTTTTDTHIAENDIRVSCGDTISVAII